MPETAQMSSTALQTVVATGFYKRRETGRDDGYDGDLEQTTEGDIYRQLTSCSRLQSIKERGEIMLTNCICSKSRHRLMLAIVQ